MKTYLGTAGVVVLVDGIFSRSMTTPGLLLCIQSSASLTVVNFLCFAPWKPVTCASHSSLYGASHQSAARRHSEPHILNTRRCTHHVLYTPGVRPLATA